jgi:transcriptional regulator with XRE-family HTH domain
MILHQGDLNLKEIKHRIKDIRREKGLSQGEVAKRMGISYTTYNDFENMVRPSVAKYIEQFASALALNPKWLLYGEDIPLDEEDKQDTISVKMMNADRDIRKMSADQQLKYIARLLRDDKELRIIIIKIIFYFIQSKQAAKDFPTSEK